MKCVLLHSGFSLCLGHILIFGISTCHFTCLCKHNSCGKEYRTDKVTGRFSSEAFLIEVHKLVAIHCVFEFTGSLNCILNQTDR